MERMSITLPKQDDHLQFNLPEPDKEMFDELKEQYEFPSSAEAGRSFLKLGMMSMVDNDPRHSISSGTDSGESNPVTIRELIPEGEDNAVEIPDELWNTILRNKIIDIIEDDPEIKRDGLKIYR